MKILRLFKAGRMRAALGFGAVWFLLATPAYGATGSDDTESRGAAQAVSNLEKAANQAYNQGDYAAAADQYRALIQAQPEHAVAYRNLARSYFWQAIYPEAVAYYDLYLRLAPDAADLGQVQSERRLAASRAGTQVWRIPTSQAQALTALHSALEDGLGLSAGEGGAWGIYQTLLRTGYAQPDLAELKRRLVRKLLNEFVGLLVPDADQPAPRLELADWTLQLERLDAARALSDDPGFLSVIERRTPLAKTAIALLTGRFEQAHSLSLVAIEQNPDMPFIRWFQVRALLELTRYAEALSALGELEEYARSANPKVLEYSAIFRASILQRMGRAEEAAAIYLNLLDGPSSAGRGLASPGGSGVQ